MTILSFIARIILRLGGWTLVGDVPNDTPKFVFTAAPHTALVDGLLMVIFAFARGFRIQYLVKDGFYKFPLRFLIDWSGGIPVDRSTSNNVVDQMVAHFNATDSMILGISPEGTRPYRPKIRTGFYHIALGAGVPVVCGFLDFKTRRVGIGDTIHLTGDIHKDIQRIASFYKDMEGKYPENFNRDFTI